MENKHMPAFPVLEQSNVGGKLLLECTAAGVNKLEFIACNAPVDIPGWFEHVSPEKNISQRFYPEDITNEDDSEMVTKWQDDPCYDLPEHLRWYSDRLKQVDNEEREYKKKDDAARYFQWRKFYAEQLLLTLEA